MEPATVAAFAERLVTSDDLAVKLERAPAGLPDEQRGPARRIAAPGRSADLAIVPGRRAKVPPVAGMADPAQRVRILHAFANHELQAAELFAWVLLAFPEAPDAFRAGCVTILAEEQKHCALYIRRLEAHGARFGDFPVSGHFWRRMAAVSSPLEFVCAMGLTLESANLDFALEFAAAARAAGDTATAAVLDVVRTDEIRHVAFGWRWFERLRDTGADAWDAYCDNVTGGLGPGRARGAHFDRAGREAAALDPAFIDRLEQVRPSGPGGAPRR